MGKRGEGWVALQMVLFVLILLAPRVRSQAFPLWLRGVGLLLLGAGGLLGTAGIRTLGRNLSAFPRPIEGGELVTTGVYGVVRHPIYAGLIVGSLGWALLTGSPIGIGLAAGLFVFFDLKSRREELWLLQAYPGYGAYRQRVRKLIPWVY